MALPKEVTFVTFDVYGTLIDWETGAYDAFRQEAECDGLSIERDELIPLFHSVQQQIQAGSYEPSADGRARPAGQIANELVWSCDASRPGFLPDADNRCA